MMIKSFMLNRSCAKDCEFVTLSDQFQLTQAIQNRMILWLGEEKRRLVERLKPKSSIRSDGKESSLIGRNLWPAKNCYSWCHLCWV